MFRQGRGKNGRNCTIFWLGELAQNSSVPLIANGDAESEQAPTRS